MITPKELLKDDILYFRNGSVLIFDKFDNSTLRTVNGQYFSIKDDFTNTYSENYDIIRVDRSISCKDDLQTGDIVYMDDTTCGKYYSPQAVKVGSRVYGADIDKAVKFTRTIFKAEINKDESNMKLTLKDLQTGDFCYTADPANTFTVKLNTSKIIYTNAGSCYELYNDDLSNNCSDYNIIQVKRTVTDPKLIKEGDLCYFDDGTCAIYYHSNIFNVGHIFTRINKNRVVKAIRTFNIEHPTKITYTSKCFISS